MSESAPDPSIDDHALRVLHGLADDAGRAELARLLAANQANRRRFLGHASLHGMLSREAKAGGFADNKVEYFHRIETVPAAKPKRFLKVWLPAAAALAAACLVAIPLLSTQANAALDRVIKVMSEARDRTYRIEVIESAPEPVESHPDRGRFPPAKHLDGANLWLRGESVFVLSQSLPNGQNRVMGSDGSQSWTLRGDGPVRVSPDPDRFGRAIFAKNGEIAFLDLRKQFDELKRLYQIEWLDRSSRETWKLMGSRRSSDQGGPREVELWFDPDTGLLERLILRHLPRGNGGPRSIAIILQSTEPLPPDFFKHESHHEPGRTILKEP